MTIVIFKYFNNFYNFFFSVVFNNVMNIVRKKFVNENGNGCSLLCFDKVDL